jgi:hypothetical protein
VSDKNELDRLRADLATLKAAFEIYDRDYKGTDRPSVIGIIESRIAKLEAEAAAPWAEANGWISSWQGQGDYPVVVSYVRHLEADNAALREEVRLSHIERDKHAAAVKARDRGIEQQKARIAQLESGEKSDSLVIRGLRMKIAELEAQPVPPLDPKRVIATACKILAENSEMYAAAWIMQTFKAGDAGIYPLAGGET